MRFALLGDHPDGLDMARALADSGRHEIAVYSGPPHGAEVLGRWGLQPRRIGDIEETLADPAVDAVIVASSTASRPAQLRRALQSEHHVLCIHPADHSPDLAHEAAMLQADTGSVLLPLCPASLHPGIQRLADLAAVETPRLIELERWSTDELLVGDTEADRKPALPDWDVLRLLGGEVVEVFAAAAEEELLPGDPLIVTGRCEGELLFQATYLPQQAATRWRLTLVQRAGRTTLEFPEGWPGPSRLSYRDADGQTRIEEWPAFNPWAALVKTFEQALDGDAPVIWQDEVRALELDDAVRRSIARRRSSTLEYQEATEEAGFKGTMTLVGCTLVWLGLAMLILALWWPTLLWLIAPVFGIFLVLQVLRWVLPAKSSEAREGK